MTKNSRQPFCATPRLFTESGLAEGQAVALAGNQSHYLQHVMRMKAGEELRLFNGRDGEWRGVLSKALKRSTEITLHEQLRAPAAEPDLWLCCAPIKKAHFDYMIEKATELGVAIIQPLLTARTQIREVNTERAHAIAIEAAEQSERMNVPDIRKPVTLEALASGWPQDRSLIVCAEWGEAEPIGKVFIAGAVQSPPPLGGGLGGGSKPMNPPPAKTKDLLKEQVQVFASSPQGVRNSLLPKAAILTGPEGGLAAEELELLRRISDAHFVRLGPRILRADTAAIAALTCWQAICGDWNGNKNG